MKRDDWKVADYSIRPNGSPTHCFYCGEPLGADHKAGCAIRSRTVVLRMTVEYTVTVPEDWDTDSIEFHRNEGSWCSGNAIEELEEINESGGAGCLCGQTSFEFVREATFEDEKRDGVFIWDAGS